MGNKLIYINSQRNTPSSSNEVYLDVSSHSEKTAYTKPLTSDEYKYICKLANEEEPGLILTEEDAKEIWLYYTKFTDFQTSLRLWRENSRYKITKSVNVQAIKNSMNNIFTWLKGERIINPDFGSTLYKHLYEGITDFNVEQIISEIRGLITKWEPRVKIDKIIDMSTVYEVDDNTVHIEIIYSIPGLTNEQYNYSLVYNKQQY